MKRRLQELEPCQVKSNGKLCSYRKTALYGVTLAEMGEADRRKTLHPMPSDKPAVWMVYGRHYFCELMRCKNKDRFIQPYCLSYGRFLTFE